MVQNGKLLVEKLILLGFRGDFTALHIRTRKAQRGSLSKCLIHASRKSGKEKREKFLVTGATRCATRFKIDIYRHEIKGILTPNSEQS